MRRILLATIAALAYAAPAIAEPIALPSVCVWGNEVSLISREPSGRAGFDSLSLVRKPGAFFVSDGHPDAAKILAMKPFAVLFPANENPPAQCTATDAAINALYAASDTVQRAIDFDVCTDRDEKFLGPDHTEGAEHLSIADRSAYDAIRDALGIAYRGTEQTDSALALIDETFCEAVAER